MSKLPRGWAKLRLGEIAARTSNVDPSRTPQETFELYSVPSFETGAPDIVQGDQIKSSKQAVEPDDVLLCKIVPHINRAWTVGPKRGMRQIASGEWIVYRNHGCDPRYLRYCLSERTFREQFLATVSGVGGSLMRARPSAVAEIEVALAPLPEQRRIVARIDSLSAKSSRARAHLDHIPRLVEKYKQSLLAAAFRGELTREWRSNAEAAWSEHSLRDLFEWSSGKNLPAKSQRSGSVPVIGGNGIGGYHDVPLIDFPTLVIGRVGAQCGNVHRSDGPAWITDNAIYAKCIAETVDLDYAVLFFRIANLNALSGGTGQPYVNQTILNGLNMPLPPLGEQREIVRRIETAFTWIDRLAAEAASARKLLGHLDAAILAKALRGELVPQDPTDEPSSALLARIRAERQSVTARPQRAGRR